MENKLIPDSRRTTSDVQPQEASFTRRTNARDLLFVSREKSKGLDKELALFDHWSGYALTDNARSVSAANVTRALHLAERLLPQIRAGKHGVCTVEIRGIGGSFAHGNPRVGLFPPVHDYEDARHLEGQKGHGHGGILIHTSGQEYPSDIDMSLIFKRVGAGLVTLGDSIEVTKAAHKILQSIYDKTRVFISIHDSDPMEVKPISEIVSNLQRN